jgi:hypothetical protein
MSTFAFAIPDVPEVPEEQVGRATLPPRYEDVVQDARINVLALPPAIGGAVWRTLLTGHPAMRAAYKDGIVPLLTRLVVNATEAHIRVDRPMEAVGRYQIGRDADADRFYLNVWIDVAGVAGRIVPPEPAGDVVPAGRVFAEHVFTRPFAPREQRKVTTLDGLGWPESVPYVAPTGDSITRPPGAASAVDATSMVEGTTVLGLDHTDQNQHVNSLAYIRLVTDAALRRLGNRAKGKLVRAVDLAYRKPCFAGDRVHVALRGFDVPGGVGAAGVVVADGDPPDRPRCHARVLMR